jgi:large subunit ribosomal protein L31
LGLNPPGSPVNQSSDCSDPGIEKEAHMKKDIHPEYKDTQVTCGCGEKFVTRSTVASASIYVEVCSVCHPFYTGKQRILDTGGRVAKFEERFGKK